MQSQTKQKLTRIELGRRIVMTSISEVIRHEDLGWGARGYVIEKPNGAVSGFIATRDEAIAIARAEWPLLDDDMSCAEPK